MRRFLLFFLVAAALLVFGAKYALEHQYQRQLDAYLIQLGSKTSINYRALEINSDLSVSIRGVQGESRLGLQPLSIDEVRVSSRDPFFVITALAKLRSHEMLFPFKVDLRGLRMDQKLLPWVASQKTCLSFQGLVDYSVISDEGDFAAAVNLNFREVAEGELELDINSLDQLLELEAVLQISKTEAEAFVRSLQLPSAGFIRGSVELASSAMEPMVQACVQQLGLQNRESYRVGVLARPIFVRNSIGYSSSGTLNSAVAGFIAGGARLSFKVSPLSGQNGFPLLPFDWANNRLDLQVDGEPIALGQKLQLDKKPVVVVEESSNTNEANLEIQASADSNPASTSAVAKTEAKAVIEYRRVKPIFEQVAIADLESHIRKQVKISRTQGKKQIQGKLVAVEESHILVLQKIHTGHVTLTVALDDISQIMARSN